MRTFFLLIVMFLIDGVVSLGLTWVASKILVLLGVQILSFWYFFTASFIWISAGIPKLLVQEESSDTIRKIAGYTTYGIIVIGAAMLGVSVNFHTIVQLLIASVLIVIAFNKHDPMKLIRNMKE